MLPDHISFIKKRLKSRETDGSSLMFFLCLLILFLLLLFCSASLCKADYLPSHVESPPKLGALWASSDLKAAGFIREKMETDLHHLIEPEEKF